MSTAGTSPIKVRIRAVQVRATTISLIFNGETKRLIKLSQSSDLKVVFRNGVQSNIGCYDEAILFSELNLSTVGELNGYLKQSAIVNNNLKFESGI